MLLRRAYGRGLGRKPTLVEEAAMSRAARLTARAEIAALDHTIGLNDLVRIDGAAARARAAMTRLFETNRKVEQAPTMADYLRERDEKAADAP